MNLIFALRKKHLLCNFGQQYVVGGRGEKRGNGGQWAGGIRKGGNGGWGEKGKGCEMIVTYCGWLHHNGDPLHVHQASYSY